MIIISKITFFELPHFLDFLLCNNHKKLMLHSYKLGLAEPHLFMDDSLYCWLNFQLPKRPCELELDLSSTLYHCTSSLFIQVTLTGWMDTKTRPLYMLCTRDPLQNKGHIQTKSEGLEKNISCKRRPKESRSCNTHIR